MIFCFILQKFVDARRCRHLPGFAAAKKTLPPPPPPPPAQPHPKANGLSMPMRRQRALQALSLQEHLEPSIAELRARIRWHRNRQLR